MASVDKARVLCNCSVRRSSPLRLGVGLEELVPGPLAALRPGGEGAGAIRRVPSPAADTDDPPRTAFPIAPSLLTSRTRLKWWHQAGFYGLNPF
jgi:hypothetical protein